MKKLIFLISLALFLVPFIVSANVLYCLSDGERLPPGCSGSGCRYTCETTLCQICTTDSGFPGVNPSTCFGQTCSFLDDGNGGAPDTQPPVLTINEPVEGEFYGSQRILFDIDVDSSSRIEFKFKNEDRWDALCDNCMHYSKHESVKEGFNEIIIRATKNKNGLVDEETRTFNVDSELPEYIDSQPNNGEFANGEFTVEYTEENLDRIELRYKGVNEGSWNGKILSGCQSGEERTCSTNLDIIPYENGEMDYQFLVCDRRANCDEGDIKRVKVDSIAPIMNIGFLTNNLFNTEDVQFDIEVNELVNIYYVDQNEKKKSICNECSEFHGTQSFSDGRWDLTIYAEDTAGGMDSEQISFTVDTEVPEIKDILPDSEFLDGEFSVIYTELSVGRVEFLHKDSEDEEWDAVNVPGCASGEEIRCDFSFDLNQHEEREVDYMFRVYDLAENFDESKVKSGKVDNTPPILTIRTPFSQGYGTKKVLFDLRASEEVDMFYVDNNDPNQKVKKLCGGCSEFSKEKSFNDGEWDITIYADDDAGYGDSESVSFYVDSKKPKIRKTEPNKGFTNGNFWIQYDETKLEGISLFYGINGNYQEIVLNNCLSGKKQECEVNIRDNLLNNGFDASAVDVYWSVSDPFITISTKVKTLDVDVTNPTYTSFDYAINEDEVEFNIEISEETDINYMDEIDGKWKSLCSSTLICEKTKSFDVGHHRVTVRAMDESENFIDRVIEFDIVE